MPNKPEVIVVTGASGGVGRAVVRRFARDGAHIGLIARGRTGLEAAAREVEELGGRALVLPCDVSDAAALDAAADAVEAEFGPIDVWVNDAMVTVYAKFMDIEPDEYRRATDVTYHGMVFGTRSALKRMIPRDHGVVVQVHSALGYRGIPLQAPYCGAKHACQGFTESVITELKHMNSKVRLSMVVLPGVNTPQFTWGLTKLPKQTTPVPPIYQPEIPADAVHHAAHHRRRQIWIGWPTVLNIVGERLAPWFLDIYLAKTGVNSQQTDQPLDPHGHDNLFAPIEEDRGAHGPFDDKAHSFSPQYEFAKRRNGILAGLGAAALGAAAARRSRR